MEVARRNEIAWETLKIFLRKKGVLMPEMRLAGAEVSKKIGASQEEMVEFSQNLLREMLDDEISHGKKKQVGFKAD